ncbi:hypothetical protein IX321_001336 [Bacteroides pyogenes]|nr:hypothetical protein [Bacteroides pyogenes]MBR8718662.1 hypothetical protein [Bacteroides pyogenes]MBR8748114.1 hypothetical protein [Bacteroides pyogenes]MBR8757185.1 hypothetical protein [Bacteroides pyogenes]MBR8780411.1 hypothetical protein [Bacteroides pyogenes]
MVQKKERTERKKEIASKPTIQMRLRKRTASKKLLYQRVGGARRLMIL